MRGGIAKTNASSGAVELISLADFKFAQSNSDLSQEIHQRNAQKAHSGHTQNSGAIQISGAERGIGEGDEHQIRRVDAPDNATGNLQAGDGLIAPDA